MEIRRTYKTTSLKHGQVEIIDEKKVREIFNQTDVYLKLPESSQLLSSSGCRRSGGGPLPIDALLKGSVVETFFSTFELVTA